MTIEGWLAVIAILATVILGIGQLRQGARIGRIEVARRSEELAGRAVASVSAALVRSGKGAQLVIRNDGPATAKSVDVRMREEDFLIHRFVGPITRLVDQQSFEIPVTITGSTPASVVVALSWTDGRGPQQERLELSTPGR